MKPQTKLQHIVVSLAEQIKPITAEQIAYAESKLFTPKFRRTRKTIHCLECGTSWKDETNQITKSCYCIGCNTKLIDVQKEQYKRYIDEMYYHAILTTVKGFQVVRMFTTRKWMLKQTKPCYSTDEVMQFWIDANGKVTTFALKVQGMSRYYDAWIYGSNLTLKPNNYSLTNRAELSPSLIHKNRIVLPILKRNGFTGNFHGFAPHQLFSFILRNNQAETLLKLKQIAVLKYLYRQPILTHQWNALKICFRNNYTITDFNIWRDYLNLLIHFGKDTRSPKYVCPSNLTAAHDKYVEKRRQERRREEIESLKKTMAAEQKKYNKAKRKFFKLLFSSGDLRIKVIPTIQEFYEIGEKQNHCIFENEYWKKSSLIFAAFLKNEVIEVVEISLENFKILQARGVNNEASKLNAKIVKLVKQNINQIKKIAVKKAA